MPTHPEIIAQTLADCGVERIFGLPGGEILALINSSERPLVLVGLGAQPAMAPAIRALADRLQAPFLITPR